jgi:hypothetical protein
MARTETEAGEKPHCTRTFFSAGCTSYLSAILNTVLRSAIFQE